MPFGNTGRAIRTYKYGALGPIEGWDRVDPEVESLIERQNHLRNIYWNKLTTVENDRRDLDWSVIKPRAQALMEAADTDETRSERESTIEHARERAIAEVKESDRYIAAINRGDDEAANALEERAIRGAENRLMRGYLAPFVKIARKEPDIVAQLDAFKEQQKKVELGLRGDMTALGLHYNNYLEIERSQNTARKGLFRPLRHEYDKDTGRISATFSNGTDVESIVSGRNLHARFEPIAPWSDRAGVKHHNRARLLRLRVGSDEKKKPIWIGVPVIVHRPLPPDGIVRSVGLNWHRRGTKIVWSVTVTVETDAIETEINSSSMVAVDLGWRWVEGNEMRAGYRLGIDGIGEEIGLSASWVAAMERVDSLKGIRDVNREAMACSLVAWLDAAPNVPQWLSELRPSIPRWMASEPFAFLAMAWRDRRFDGDKGMYEHIETWRKQDKHIFEREANLRDNLLAERKERYRLLAVELSRRYDRLVLEKFDLRRLASKAGSPKTTSAQRQRRSWVAPSQLRLALINAFTRDHGKESVIYVNPKDTTRTCNVCREITAEDSAGIGIVHQCRRCNSVWDRDRNACLNILSRANPEGRIESDKFAQGESLAAG